MDKLTVLVVLSIPSMSVSMEPKCSEFHFLESLLEKVIRIENKMDKVSSDLQKDVELVRNELVALKASRDTDVAGKIKELENTIKTTTDEIGLLRTSHVSGTDRKAQIVAFTAYKDETQRYITEGHFILFDHIVTNQGNHYNPGTGVFTAPRQGLYVFTWHTMSETNFVTCLALNDVCKVDAFCTGGLIKFMSPDGNSAILDLLAGDTVAIKAVYGDQVQAASNRRYPTFSGYSL